MNRYVLIFISTFVLCYSSVAQVESQHQPEADTPQAKNPDFIPDGIGTGGEVLLELQVNPQLIGNSNNSLSPLFKTNHTTNFFLIDTIGLPFIDDFSANLLKSYDPADYPDSLVFDSIAYDFQVGGLYPDTLQYSIDTTWNYIYDTLSSVLDSTALTQLEVINFNDPNNPFIPTDTSYFWPPYNTYDTIPPGPPADTIYISNQTTLFNQIDTIKVYPPDSVSLWVDNYAFINSTYPIDPITVGVATLDGVNEFGRPYDFSMPQTYGIADYLTSKPINLNLPASDSIYLSFFYQPEGIGNDPQPEDSLVLEFYSPLLSQWFNIWSVEGSPNQNFNQVMILIADAIYLQKGFQFRFKNYATLSGNLDHWHIDYIYVDDGRNINDSIIDDIGLRNNTGSLLNVYQSVPWKHFLNDNANTVFTMINSIVAYTFNLNDSVEQFTHKYRIINEQDSIYLLNFGQNNISGKSIDSVITPLDYRFYSTNTDSATFKVELIFHPKLPNVDINRSNDTSRFIQNFYNYYAYDDGSAEAGYGLNAIGAQLAYRFTLNQPDTLRAIQMYFNQQLNDVSQEAFYLTVWDDASGPGNIIYQKAGVRPVYEDSLNKFHTYLIDDTIIVLSGTYYIGWVQTTDDLLNIGFDRNTNSNTNMFFNVTGTWQNTIIPGSWMIRPVFGDTVILPAGVPPKIEPVKTFNFNIYPNPAKDKIYLVNMPNDNCCNLQVTLYDMWGRAVYSEKGTNFIDVSNLSEGIYMIRIDDFYNHNSSTRKILITR